MKFIGTLLLSVVICTQAFASDWPSASLFMTKRDNEQAVRLARQTFPSSGGIRLGAILFFGEDDWTIWLQGEKWTPETQRNDMRVISVTPHSVRLTVYDENGTGKDVELGPNQSYIPD